ncbi:unnamed protein product [Rhizophagus irregularis]|nr:unnamed protein product [Rhizophagus irregularis]CAB5375506.1 unnamed protein product [Rhizophagus irregularis]
MDDKILNIICIILIPITIIFTGFIVIIHILTLSYLIIKSIIQYFINFINKEEEEDNGCWIPFQQLKQIEFIASGGFGRVFKALLDDDSSRLIFESETKSKIFKSGREVAIKYITCSNLSEFHAHKLCIKSKSVIPLIDICSGIRPEIHSGIPKFFEILMKSCWDEDYLKRPSMELVLKYVRNLYINFDQEILDFDNSNNSNENDIVRNLDIKITTNMNDHDNTNEINYYTLCHEYII